MAVSINTNNIGRNNQNNLNSGSAEVLASQSGIGNDRRKEPIPFYIQADAETLIKSPDVNASIVFGNDRPGNLASGHGGKGDTQCASIDIVAGRASQYLVEVSKENENIYVSPNVKGDAARIYISQKTDIDSNFGLVDGRSGNSKNKSAVAVKADGVRIIARESIKLVTRTDAVNSNNEPIAETNGVEIIALNSDTSLQSMVLGENLVEYLTKLTREVDNLQNRVAAVIDEQHKFNKTLATHQHISNAPGSLTLPAASVMLRGLSITFKKIIDHDIGLYFQKFNFGALSNDYFNSGPKSIKSKYNKVN